MSRLDKLLLQNSNVFEALPWLGGPAARFLLSRSGLSLDDLRFRTRHSSGYALISEKNSSAFLKVMDRMRRYIGCGEIGPNKAWEYPWALANMRLEKGMKVLDAGCGKSALQFLLHDVGCEVHCIDPFEDAKWHGIDRGLARRFGCDIEYRREGIEAISYPDDTFDRVCCVSVIEHCRAGPAVGSVKKLSAADLELHGRMMREMIRALKPGGLLVVTVDFNITRDDVPLESNVNVANLIAIEGAEILPGRCDGPFPGEDAFDAGRLIHNHDIDISNYMDILQTSIGITLRKADRHR